MTYEPDINAYRCEQGKLLKYMATRKQQGKVSAVYRAVSDCTDCPLKQSCMKSESGKRRTLKIGIYDDRLKIVAARFDEAEHRKRYHNRGPNKAHAASLRAAAH